MSLHPKAIADLEWWFGETIFARSTFGATLERQQNRYYDSDGQVIPRPEAGHRVIKEARVESGYEPEPGAMARHGRISRRVAKCGRGSLHVLSIYYGHEGSRWEQEDAIADAQAQKAEPKDAAGEAPLRPFSGLRLGRTWSLVAMTPTGKRMLARLASARDKLGQPASTLMASEQLAEEAQSQRTKPNDRRRAELAQARDEADALLVEAQREWAGTREAKDTASARPDRRV